MAKTTGAVVLLVLLLPLRLEAQRGTSADPLLGCYRIEVGEWIPRDHPEREHPVQPPEEFRLLAEIGTKPFERDRALARPLLRAQDGGGANWERVGPDSVRVSWSTGLWGTQLQLRIDGESLRGTATSWTDVMYLDAGGKPLPNLHADVVARPMNCLQFERD